MRAARRGARATREPSTGAPVRVRGSRVWSMSALRMVQARGRTAANCLGLCTLRFRRAGFGARAHPGWVSTLGVRSGRSLLRAYERSRGEPASSPRRPISDESAAEGVDGRRRKPEFFKPSTLPFLRGTGALGKGRAPPPAVGVFKRGLTIGGISTGRGEMDTASPPGHAMTEEIGRFPFPRGRNRFKTWPWTEGASR